MAAGLPLYSPRPGLQINNLVVMMSKVLKPSRRRFLLNTGNSLACVLRVLDLWV